ncbi:MAG: thiamine pyrophosphate-binding protein [Spirochaetes bacterium]|nr:MAG: thiamine pyrophosphate-binding protein [Spirochaetota bacterium]
MKTVAEQIAYLLKKKGVRCVFGLPGGSWIPYMEALYQEKIEFILVSNEASGGFMAEVFGRLTGIPGVCYGTLGPGATNLSSGVGTAFLDKSPLIALTTEVPDSMLGRTTQMAIDHQALFKPLTKWTTRLSRQKVEETFYKAIQIATSEVPGPVHIGLPADIGGKSASEEVSPDLKPLKPEAPDPLSIEKLESLFKDTRRPVLAAGLTALRYGTGDLIRKIAEKHRIPVVLTPMAKGLIPENHPAYAGVLFHALSDIVAETYTRADAIIGVGYDPVEFNYEEWLPPAPLVHIGTVPADIDREKYTVALEVLGDLYIPLKHLADMEASGKDWDFGALAERRRRMFDALKPSGERFGPLAVLDILKDMLPDNAIMTCDVGAHTHLIGQKWPTPAPYLQIMTNGWSSMGYGVPAAIGAKLCKPDRTVVCVTGDGGFLMMAGEMATALRLGVHVVFIILVDRRLELIRIKQKKNGFKQSGTILYKENYISSSTIFGVPVLSARNSSEYRDVLERALGSEGPVIVEAIIDGEEYDNLILRKNR